MVLQEGLDFQRGLVVLNEMRGDLDAVRAAVLGTLQCEQRVTTRSVSELDEETRKLSREKLLDRLEGLGGDRRTLDDSWHGGTSTCAPGHYGANDRPVASSLPFQPRILR